MSNAFELSAEVRQVVGKGASRRLRRDSNLVPAIIYGGDEGPQMLTLLSNKVRKALENEAFYSHILTIDIAGKKQQAVLKALQRHPAKRHVIHMDFLRITGKEAITMRVPLHFLNGDKAPGVKDGGVLTHTATELEIKCLPKDLPEYIAVDVGSLGMDEALHFSDIKLPPGVTHAGHGIDEDHDQPIASIHAPRAVLEDEPSEAPVATEVPTIASTTKDTDEE